MGQGDDVMSEIREAVRSRYANVARQLVVFNQTGSGPEGCCQADGPDCGCSGSYSAEALQEIGLTESVSLGCGNPTMLAELKPGETVLDLGSGGGLDVLLSARRVAPGGTAYGLDASRDMLALARANAAAAGVANARFLHGHIEEIPLPDGYVDVVISNCVINLSTDKPHVLAEAFRVLRPGGRLGISDVTADEDTDPGQLAQAEQRAGCISGTLTQPQYRDLLLAAGFTAITITSTNEAGTGLHSAIIQATKPACQHT